MRLIINCIFCIAVVGMTSTTIFAQGKPVESKSLELKRLPSAGLPGVVMMPRASYKHLDGHRVVFAVNGVANGTAVTEALLGLNGECGLGLCIRNVSWCRHDSIKLDLVDHDAQLNAAVRIASEVTMIRKDAPNAKIYFVAHSAGTRIALAAAEMLPAQSVDRIIVIASAVSCSYDLTGALRASRFGIDHFYSTGDSILDAATEAVGTADGLRSAPAGRTGFRLAFTDRKDIEAYRNLRQYAWKMDYAGHGGHFTWTNERNMKNYVVPLLFVEPHAPVVVTEPIKGPARK